MTDNQASGPLFPIPEGFRDWVAMVAKHSAKHVQAGCGMDRAIELGMRDYTAQLNRISEGLQDAKDGFSTADARYARDSVSMVGELAYAHITEGSAK